MTSADAFSSSSHSAATAATSNGGGSLGSARGALYGTDGGANSLWWRRVTGLPASAWFRLLSPFALWPTFAGVLIGNIVVTAGVFVLSLLIIPLYKRARPKRTWLDCCCICRFPSININLMYNLLCGTAVAAAAVISSLWHDMGDDIEGLRRGGFFAGGGGGPLSTNDSVRAMGAEEHPAIIALAFATALFVLLLPAGLYYGCRHYFAPMRFVRIKAPTTRMAGFLLPAGQIQPYPARTAFVSIVGDSTRPSIFWCLLPSLLPLWLFVTYLASSTYCAVFVFLAAIGAAAQLALVAHFRPYLSRARNFGEVASLLLACGSLLFLALALWSVETAHALAEDDADRLVDAIVRYSPSAAGGRYTHPTTTSRPTPSPTTSAPTSAGTPLPSAAAVGVEGFFTVGAGWRGAVSLGDDSPLFFESGLGSGNHSNSSTSNTSTPLPPPPYVEAGGRPPSGRIFPRFAPLRDALLRAVLSALLEPSHFALSGVFEPTVVLLTLLACIRIPNLFVTFLALDDPWRTKWDQPGSDAFGLSNVLWTRLAPRLSTALFMHLKRRRKRPERSYRRGKLGKALRQSQRNAAAAAAESAAKEKERETNDTIVNANPRAQKSVVIGGSSAPDKGTIGERSRLLSATSAAAADGGASAAASHRSPRGDAANAAVAAAGEVDQSISHLSPIPSRRQCHHPQHQFSPQENGPSAALRSTTTGAPQHTRHHRVPLGATASAAAAAPHNNGGRDRVASHRPLSPASFASSSFRSADGSVGPMDGSFGRSPTLSLFSPQQQHDHSAGGDPSQPSAAASAGGGGGLHLSLGAKATKRQRREAKRLLKAEAAAARKDDKQRAREEKATRRDMHQSLKCDGAVLTLHYSTSLPPQQRHQSRGPIHSEREPGVEGKPDAASVSSSPAATVTAGGAAAVTSATAARPAVLLSSSSSCDDDWILDSAVTAHLNRRAAALAAATHSANARAHSVTEPKPTPAAGENPTEEKRSAPPLQGGSEGPPPRNVPPPRIPMTALASFPNRGVVILSDSDEN